ncbi:PAS domain S-box-containing protein [Rhodoblastus acidophilus]|uniref:PAS domain-containing protein n=1 Tax=Rhodoblastus acidophilus TaxID=1074 RepID=UPI0022259F03|nr:PAS domain-containing protein [Rhodoblastus acidophilus]MCW2315459.1 PAS domain S-box-containing protein [Rhodoblastus acidophilus]
MARCLGLGRARADAARARSDDPRLRSALEACGVGIGDIDFLSGAVTLSAEWRRIWGLAEWETATIDGLNAMVLEEDRAARTQAQALALDPRGPGLYRARFRIRHGGDGAPRWVCSRGKIQFENGVAVRLIGITRDVTDEMAARAALEQQAGLAELDRVRAEQSAREQQRLALALEAGAIGTFEADLLANEIRPSDKLRQIWGWPDDRPIQPGVLDALVVEEDVAARREALARVRRDQGRYAARFRIRRANDGALRWIDTRGEVQFDGDVPVRVFGVSRDVTDEMEAAAVLQEQARERQRLALALEAGAIGTFEADLVKGDMRLSEKHREICGWASDDPLPVSVMDEDMVVDEDRAALQAARARALSGADQFHARFRIRRANDGAVRWVESRGQVQFEGGAPVWAFGVTRDITDEKQAAAIWEEKAALAEQARLRAEELALEQQRLKLALEAGSIGTFEAELPDGEPVGNAKWLEIMGFAPGAPVTARRVEALVIDEDRAGRRAAHAAARDPASGGYFACQHRIRRASDGALRWIDSRGLISFRDGVPVQVRGVNRDVTDEVEAAAALKEKARLAERLTLLAEALPGAIYSYVLAANGDRLFSYMSPNARSLLGFGPALHELDLARLSARIPADDLADLLTARDVSYRHLTPWAATFRYNHPTRGEIWLSADSRPARRDDGAMVWHGYIHDVTERETAARALAESEARVRALKDERLAALEKMAASLAHEVNQALAAGATLLAVARRRFALARLRGEADPDLDAAAKAQDKAADQLLRAGRIISRVREFSRHGEPDKTFRNLHDIVRETVAGLEDDASFAGFEIEIRLEAARDAVLIDRTQIASVLINLLQNARQAARPEGPRTIVVASRNHDQDIVISVIDYGSGLSEDVQRHMFELFWTTKRSGMGVGLAMAKAIVEAHYGSIWPDVARAEGTVFNFSLPLIETSAGGGEME